MKLKKKYLISTVVALMTVLVFTGCENSEENKLQEEETPIHTEESSSETSQGNDKENEEEDIWSKKSSAMEEIADGEITISDKGYVYIMDELFKNFHEYIGREVTYEGFVYKIEDAAEDIFVVGRYHDISHGTHNHESVMGFEGLYDGTWPEINTWVQVKGVIEERVLDGQVLPALRITEITEKAERGQEKVYY